MKVLVTGASGFVGSNIVKVLSERHGHETITDRVDMCDAAAVKDHVGSSGADAVVHCAILNDWSQMVSDRHYAWNSYVEATRYYGDAAKAVDIPLCLISTDWVFDGTQSLASEDTPPNPINLYGFLKAASEIVALDRGGAIARVMGVNGMHWARPSTPRAQDQGFGYFAASIVDALEDGQPFTVWEGENVNGIASPSLASHCGEVATQIVQGGHRGVFHCCGSDSVSRREFAEAVVTAFDLDIDLLNFGPVPTDAFSDIAVPFDTSVSAEITSETLGTPLLSIDEILEDFRTERSTGALSSLRSGQT